MSSLFADRLFNAIREKASPICVGIDPIFDSFPDSIAGTVDKRNGNDVTEVLDAIFKFTTSVLNIVAPHVACVKFQSAYFEKYLHEGVEAYYSLMQAANELDLLVIGDVKRGDIGSTATAYAAAHLGDSMFDDHDDIHFPDAITVNPMLGMDTLDPFVKVAKDDCKGLFVLVRTSNPGSAELQDVQLADGRTWSQMLATKVNTLATSPELMGRCGFSSIGAVVGATQTHTIEAIRKCLPHSYFLLPGYGAQGATAEMTRAAFTNGQGALISASRSILYAHKEKKYADISTDWEKCVERAVLDMKADIAGILK